MIGKTISHYKILEKLGEGGMGIVYKAEDTKLKRTVALKFLPPEFTRDKEAKTRFVHEAQSASALEHNNICNIHEIDETDDGHMFIAMAYYEGETLKEKIASQPLPITEAINITIQIAQGLIQAHKKDIVHRDIKSANIIITSEGVAKILDFGLAKLKGQTKLTKEGTIPGTVAYMSPEQTTGEEVDQRTDIWSLGVVFYEMLTGQLPFKGHYDQAIMYSIMNEEPNSITSLHAGVPTELEQITKKALEKEKDERYQNTDNLLVELKSCRKKIESGIFEKQLRKTKPKPSIAVLPFRNMSSDVEQEYFCEGISEEIINALTHIEDLRVIARTSAFSFKGKFVDVREIGRKLDVDSLLEGSVRKVGNRLRITAQLIKASDGSHLWSEKFDRDIEDIFAIQDEISLAIVDRLKVSLMEKEKEQLQKRYTEDQEAYFLYLKGVFHLNKYTPEGSKKALEYFQKAVEKDQQFALAYVGIADSYGNLGNLSILPPEEVLLKSKDALNRALEIDDSLSEAHGALAFLAFFYEWNWDEAENRYKKTLHLNPGDARAHGWFAWFLLAMGRFDDAIKEIKKAQEIDPLLPLYYAFAIAIYGYPGKFSKSIEQFHKAIELEPNFGLAYFHLGSTYFSQKKYDDAINSFQKAKELSTGSGWAESCLGATYAILGKADKAKQILKQMISQKKDQYISPFCIAFIFYYLGEKDKALEWFEKAFQEGDIMMAYAKVMFGFDEIRKEPKFQAIMKKMKLIK